MATIGAGVTLRGYYFEPFLLPVNLASGITKADEGKALTIDTSKANTFKLAGDGDPIHARLEVVENRVQEGVLVGTAAFKFAATLPIKSGQTVNVGDAVQGAGNGEIKALAATLENASGATAIAHTKHDGNTLVVEVDAAAGLAVVIKL